jgi:hypothetical protein
MVDGTARRTARSLHVVERYRMLDYEAAKEGSERDRKEYNELLGCLTAILREVPAAPLHGRRPERPARRRTPP